MVWTSGVFFGRRSVVAERLLMYKLMYSGANSGNEKGTRVGKPQDQWGKRYLFIDANEFAEPIERVIS